MKVGVVRMLGGAAAVLEGKTPGRCMSPPNRHGPLASASNGVKSIGGISEAPEVDIWWTSSGTVVCGAMAWG